MGEWVLAAERHSIVRHQGELHDLVAGEKAHGRPPGSRTATGVEAGTAVLVVSNGIGRCQPDKQVYRRNLPGMRMP
jgi:hypothetical protein